MVEKKGRRDNHMSGGTPDVCRPLPLAPVVDCCFNISHCEPSSYFSSFPDRVDVVFFVGGQWHGELLDHAP